MEENCLMELQELSLIAQHRTAAVLGWRIPFSGLFSGLTWDVG
jgi:hypothetical protein